MIVGGFSEASGMAGRSEADGGVQSERQIAASAREFEALLIGQMLRSIREANGGSWLGSDDDQSAGAIADYAEQQVASAMAQAGGLGLSALIASGLRRSEPQTQSGSNPGSSREPQTPVQPEPASPR